MDQALLPLLQETIDAYFNMSRNNLQLLAEHCTILKLEKQQTFIRQGLANEQEYFLLDGLVRRLRKEIAQNG
ncbi:MAG: hypothetical protein DYG98_23330 [Haliscomenobacteraceae bacterium CHB4]|nr:hypothetical protein [Saprospiraceae bacterium]MCE7925993.1 hypothetical protein [Haliscomenobacteraceae bacterium CHB4]